MIQQFRQCGNGSSDVAIGKIRARRILNTGGDPADALQTMLRNAERKGIDAKRREKMKAAFESVAVVTPTVKPSQKKPRSRPMVFEGKQGRDIEKKYGVPSGVIKWSFEGAKTDLRDARGMMDDPSLPQAQRDRAARTVKEYEDVAKRWNGHPETLPAGMQTILKNTRRAASKLAKETGKAFLDTDGLLIDLWRSEGLIHSPRPVTPTPRPKWGG